MNTISSRRFAALLISFTLLSIFAGCATMTDADMVARSEFDASESERMRLASETDTLRAQNQELERLNNERQAIYDDLSDRLQSLIDAGTLTIGFRRGVMVIELPNRVLFDTGSSKLKPEGAKTLKEVAHALRDLQDRRLFVAGHTDNVPVRQDSDTWKSNWHLSNDRAISVLQILTKEGVSPKILASAGFGEHDPIADNKTDDGRAQNRRTELMLIPNLEGVVKTVKTSKKVKVSER